MKDITPEYKLIPLKYKVVLPDNTGFGTQIGGLGTRLASTVSQSINSNGDLVNDVINDNLDTSAKEILGDFIFGASGAIKMITDEDNGLWISPTGILAKKAGSETLTVTTGGDVTMIGTITATIGSIGGWTISSTAIYLNGATDAISSGMASADYPFYAGKKYADRATAPFRVTPAGALTATDVDVTGTINISNPSDIDGSTITNDDGWTDDTAADLRVTSFYQSAIPTSLAAGDMWLDSDDGKLYRATGIGDTTIEAGKWIRIDTGLYPGLIDALNTTNAPAAAGADVTGDNQAATIASQGNLATLDTVSTTECDATIISGGKIVTGLLTASNIQAGSLNAQYIGAGTITSKAITLAVAAGTGDVKIQAGKTDFTNTDNGFIIGIDDSDADKAKLYIGDSSTYLNWDGTNMIVKAGTGSSIDFSYVDGAEKPADNATVGATAGTDLKDSGAVVLEDNQVKNIINLDYGETLAGATLPVAVYQSTADNEVYACDADDATKLKFIGFAISSVGDGVSGKVQTSNAVGGFTGLSEGELYYVQDDKTIGTDKGTYVVLVGRAVSTTELRIIEENNDASNSEFIASTNLRASADTARNSTADAYEKLKEIKVKKAGAISVLFDLKVLVATDNAYGKIYVNGIAVGSERNDNTGNYQTFTETIGGLAADDLVQLYIKRSGSGATAYCRNFRLKYDKVPVEDYIINTD